MTKPENKPKKNRKTDETKPPADVTVDRRREWRLELPLSALVEGELPQGSAFKEVTTLENISSTGAYFCLDSGVTVGSKLNLVIEIPDKLTEGKKTRLSLGGLTVRLEQPNKQGKRQGVAIRFDEDFRFVIEEEDKRD